MCVCLYVTDNMLVSSSRDGTVCLWNLETLELIKTLQKHSDEINSLSTSVSYMFMYLYSLDVHVYVCI